MSEPIILTIGDKHLSSWSLRPWLVLKMFGIPFEEDAVRLDRPDTSEAIAERSSAGLVPVLRRGRLTVWDSLAIIEYAAVAFPDAPVWPAEPHARAVARSVSAEMHSGFSTLRALWPMQFARLDIGGPMTPALRRDIARIDSIWRDCREAHGAEGGFLFGAFCAADAMYAPVVSRFMTYRGASGDTVVDDYCQRVWSLPAMREWGAGARAELSTAARPG